MKLDTDRKCRNLFEDCNRKPLITALQWFYRKMFCIHGMVTFEQDFIDSARQNRRFTSFYEALTKTPKYSILFMLLDIDAFMRTFITAKPDRKATSGIRWSIQQENISIINAAPTQSAIPFCSHKTQNQTERQTKPLTTDYVLVPWPASYLLCLSVSLSVFLSALTSLSWWLSHSYARLSHGYYRNNSKLDNVQY